VRFFGRWNEQNVIRYDGIQAGTIIDSNPAALTGANGASQFRLSQSLDSIQEFHIEGIRQTPERVGFEEHIPSFARSISRPAVIPPRTFCNRDVTKAAYFSVL
jgi:hypothetical protein